MTEVDTTEFLNLSLDGGWSAPDQELAFALSELGDYRALQRPAASLRNLGFGGTVSYSRKVFVPLTRLCRDVCHYCTFATTPKRLDAPYLSEQQVLKLVQEAASQGCKEVLFTLGERPELRYRTARETLAKMGFATTLQYLQQVAGTVLRETGLLPHINAGCMSESEMAGLRQVSASMGLMLESASMRLCEPGMPHYGSPDKLPANRLETLRIAGSLKVPFTSGLLIGIGETRRERVESLLALREASSQDHQLQEIIIQNFRAKPGTLMAEAPEPDLEELCWTIAVARLLFGPQMSIQAPPNLSPGVLPALIGAGINDWGGVSPVTPDHVNPEAPWPTLSELERQSADAGKQLIERLTIYPRFLHEPDVWLDPALHRPVLNLSDAHGLARSDTWRTGSTNEIPAAYDRSSYSRASGADADVQSVLDKVRQGVDLSLEQVESLFSARGASMEQVCDTARDLCLEAHGLQVSYVVTRNINYTNLCGYHCSFCAFSKGRGGDDLRGRPYDLADEEISRRVSEAWSRGATEVCLQGGIHPDYTGQKYLDLCALVREAAPNIHLHAFSPLEVSQGAATLGVSLREFLLSLKAAGLATLPGTAAEILDDEVRRILCPDKLNTAEWLNVMETAHGIGLQTTATIMFGHVDKPVHWARHLLRVRDLQRRTGGFTELVPLPFVAAEAPIYRRGRARPGPDFREALLMHAVSRLVLHQHIPNIQTSWVKMGRNGALACLDAGANDLGGTLMNESITRAAGAEHGQEFAPRDMQRMITAHGREPWQRSTRYQRVADDRVVAANAAPALVPVINTPVPRRRGARGARQNPATIQAANA